MRQDLFGHQGDAAVILAVAHREFQALGEAGIRAYGVPNAVIFDVKSLLPRGVRVKWSGTSLAAPQLVNLAAKMLALRPDLTPAQILSMAEPA